jgi:hypothetical protein
VFKFDPTSLGRLGFDKLGLDKIPAALRDGAAFARKALEEGATYAKSSLSDLPVLSSVFASTPESGERDETHYFLVPLRSESCGYVLFTIRRIPEGYAQANGLSRVRVFHLPGEGAEERIEAMILKDLLADARGEGGAEAVQNFDFLSKPTTLAGRLKTIADEIDKQSNKVTGGLLVIGGIAAVANPLVGAGIAAKALWPSLGAIASREGLRHVADRLKAREKAKADQEAERDEEARELAAQEQAREAYKEGGEVLAQVNPLLQGLEAALDRPESEHDPLLDFDFEAFRFEGWDDWEMLKLTAHVVTEVYREILADPKAHEAAGLGPEDVRWLGVVATYGEEHGRP